MYMYEDGGERLVSEREYFTSRSIIICVFSLFLWITLILMELSGGSLINKDYSYFAIDNEPVLNSEYYYYYKKNLNALKLKDPNFDGVESLDNKYDEKITYQEYLKYLTVDSLRKKQVLLNTMIEEDFKATPVDEDKIMTSEELKYNASNLSDSISFNNYLKEVYTFTMTPEQFVRLSKEDNYINQFESHLIRKKMLSDKDIIAKYKDNPEYYYTVDYIEYNLGAAINDDEAKELFNSIETKTDFFKLIEEIEGEGVDIDIYRKSDLGMYAIGDKIKSDWLYSKDRKPNSMAILKNDDETYSILMYESKEIDRSEGWTFRSIFIPDGSFKTKEEREKKVKDIVSEFRENNSTESSFMNLANKYSVSETGSSRDNYYERVFEKDTIIDPEVVQFLKLAKPGDLKTIHLDKGSYIILFKERTGERWLEYLISLEESQSYEGAYIDLFNKNKAQVGLYEGNGNNLILDQEDYIKYSFIENIKQRR